MHPDPEGPACKARTNTRSSACRQSCRTVCPLLCATDRDWDGLCVPLQDVPQPLNVLHHVLHSFVQLHTLFSEVCLSHHLLFWIRKCSIHADHPPSVLLGKSSKGPSGTGYPGTCTCVPRYRVCIPGVLDDLGQPLSTNCIMPMIPSTINSTTDRRGLLKASSVQTEIHPPL